MNLLEQAAGVWARKWIVLGVAVLVAVVVFGVRSAAAEQYGASTTVQVRLPDTLTGDPASQVAFYAQTSGGLATSRDVVAAALAAAGRDDSVDDVDAAVAAVSATLGREPGFLTLAASGSSPQEAVELADALTEVLIDQVATEQADDLTDQRDAVTQAIAELGRDRAGSRRDGADAFERAALEREREALLGSLRTISEKTPWRLAVVEPAVLPTAPSAPNPLRDALLALVLALIVGAEAVVAVRAWRGALSARDPAEDAGEVAGVPGFVVRPGQAASALTGLLPTLGSARTVNVVQSGGEPQARTAALVAELLAARGDTVLLVDAGRARPAVHLEYDVAVAPGLAELRQNGASSDQLSELPRVRTLSVLAAGTATPLDRDLRLSEIVEAAPQARVAVATSIGSVDDLLEVTANLDGPTVLDVGSGTSRSELRALVEALRGLGLDLVAVTVSTGSPAASGRQAGRTAVTTDAQA